MGDVALVECECNERAHSLPPLHACSTGIDHKAAQRAVGHDLEDVTVTANEQLGSGQLQALPDTRSILARIAADVGHHHLDTLDLKDFHLLEAPPQARPVHITMDSTEHRRDGFQTVGEVITANVAVDTTAIACEYNVVVASFSQRINAKSYCERLSEECGLKDSYILRGGPDNEFYVIAQGFDNREAAAAFISDINNKVCLKILEPIPWILRKI